MIKCKVIDDHTKTLKEDIEVTFPVQYNRERKDDVMDELKKEFDFEYIDSWGKTHADYLFGDPGTDFYILDARAKEGQDGPEEHTLALIPMLKNKGIPYCIFTSYSKDVAESFKVHDCKVFKKDWSIGEKEKSVNNCDGGFLEMLYYIKEELTFGKYLRFLKYVDNQYFHELMKEDLYKSFSNFLSDPKDLKEIEGVKLTNFVNFSCMLLIKLGMIPDLSYYNKSEEEEKLISNPTNCINFLLSPRLYKTSQEECKSKFGLTYETTFFSIPDKSKSLKESNFLIDIGLSDHTTKFHLKNSLIGQTLHVVWIYRNKGQHGRTNLNSALRIVYDSILFICDRLNIIFDYLEKEDHKLLEKFKKDIDELEVEETEQEEVDQMSHEEDEVAEDEAPLEDPVEELAPAPEEPVAEEDDTKGDEVSEKELEAEPVAEEDLINTDENSPPLSHEDIDKLRNKFNS